MVKIMLDKRRRNYYERVNRDLSQLVFKPGDFEIAHLVVQSYVQNDIVGKNSYQF